MLGNKDRKQETEPEYKCLLLFGDICWQQMNIYFIFIAWKQFKCDFK